MDKNINSFIYLIGCAINNVKPNNISFDEKEVFDLSKKHMVSCLLYQAIKDIDASSDFKKALETKFNKNIKKTMMFDEERNSIIQDLENNATWYLFLKGINLNSYYPKYGTREFADNDILFDISKRKIVKNIFKKRGYEIELYNKSNHDVYFKKPFFNFEMHTSLIDSSYYPLADYLSLFPSKKIKDDNNLFGYHFSKEDEYIFFMCHAFKHFSNSGTGLRFLIDLYLYNHNNRLDAKYLTEQFNIIGINDFVNVACSLANKLFNKPSLYLDLNEEENDMVNRILSSGTYGTFELFVESKVNEHNGNKLSYIFKRIFPSYRWCKEKHPFFAYTIIFIPVLFIARCFKGLFQYKKHKKELAIFDKIKNESNNA